MEIRRCPYFITSAGGLDSAFGLPITGEFDRPLYIDTVLSACMAWLCPHDTKCLAHTGLQPIAATLSGLAGVDMAVVRQSEDTTNRSILENTRRILGRSLKQSRNGTQQERF